MKIGIDASRAFEKKRTGVGEYANEIISFMIKNNDFLKKHKIILYIKPKQKINQKIPNNWKIQEIKMPILWSQMGLSFRCFKDNLNAIYIPSHSLPLMLPNKTKKIYVLHGIELLEKPKLYSLFSRIINGYLLKKSLTKADKIISVSKTSTLKAKSILKKEKIKNYKKKLITLYQDSIINEKTPEILKKKKYIIYIGSMEPRKNIENIIKSFNLIKKTFRKNTKKYKKYNDLKLILCGMNQYGKPLLHTILPKFLITKLKVRGWYNYYINNIIKNSKYKKDIIKKGYINKNNKELLLKNACCLICPSLAEGFSRTILEAIKLNTPVITSNIQVHKELYKDFNNIFFVNHKNINKIAKKTAKIVIAHDKTKNKTNNKSNKKSNNKKAKYLLYKKYNWNNVAKKTVKILISL